MNLAIIREGIEKAWSFETGYCDNLFEYQIADDRAYGQCATTALLVQVLLGGLLMKGVVNGKPHYWNFINGLDIDLTWRQFPAGTRLTEIQQAFKEDLVQNDWMKQRYHNLVKAYGNTQIITKQD